FQSRSAQVVVIAVDRNRTGTPLPNMIELRSGGLTILGCVLLARHAHHVGSPHIDAISTGAEETKLGCRIAQRCEDRLHDALAALRQNHCLAVLQIGDLDCVGAEILARRLPPSRQTDRRRQHRHAIDAMIIKIRETLQAVGVLELGIRQCRAQAYASQSIGKRPPRSRCRVGLDPETAVLERIGRERHATTSVWAIESLPTNLVTAALELAAALHGPLY